MVTTTKATFEEDSSTTEDLHGNNEKDKPDPSALGQTNDSILSNPLFYVVGGIVLVAIAGAVGFIIIRKRKQTNENINISSRYSTASSMMSGADLHENAEQ